MIVSVQVMIQNAFALFVWVILVLLQRQIFEGLSEQLDLLVPEKSSLLATESEVRSVKDWLNQE